MVKKKRSKKIEPPLERKAEASISESDKADKRLYYGLAIAAAVITFIVFLPTLGCEFLLWDDNTMVVDKALIRTLSLDSIKGAFFTVGIITWYPFTIISFIFDYAIWGLNPVGFHLTNNIFHSANAFLVFLLTVRLVTIAKGSKDGEAPELFSLVAGIVTALLFALHPLRVESVAWVSERKDVLYGFFYLLGMITYLSYAIKERKSPFLYLLTLVFFISSLMSKPMSATFPMVLLILDFYPLKRFSFDNGLKGIRRVIIEKIPFFIFSLGLAILQIVIANKMRALEGMGGMPGIDRFMMGIRSYAMYIYKTLVPAGLAPYYPVPDVIPLISVDYLGSIFLFIFITAITVYLLAKKGQRWALALWLYYVITLLPVSGIIQTSAYEAALRYTYLPGLAMVLPVGLLAAVAYTKSTKNLRNVTVAVTAVIFLLLSYGTVGQIGNWKNSISLWSYQLEVLPGTWIGYNNRGKTYLDMGEEDKALKDYNEGIRINPRSSILYNNRANVYVKFEKPELAFKDYAKAIEIAPGTVSAYQNRGHLYAELNDLDNAMSDYSRALEIDDERGNIYIARGKIYGRQGKIKEAVTDFSEAIKINPSNGDAFYNRGVAYRRLGEKEKAIIDLTHAIEFTPLEADAYFNRALLYGEIDKIDKSLGDFTSAIELDKEFADAYYGRSFVYFEMGESAKAKRDLKVAAKLGHEGAKKRLSSKIKSKSK